MHRYRQTLPFVFADEATESNTNSLDAGCFGHILVPTGSDLIGKTYNLVEVFKGADYELLESDKTFVAGSNPLTAEEIAQVGAANDVKLVLGDAVEGEQTCYLQWKS